MTYSSTQRRFWQDPIEDQKLSRELPDFAIGSGTHVRVTRAEPLTAYSLGFRFWKRAFDIVFSLVVVVLGLIPSLIVAAIIAIDSPGAPIFRQPRIGQHGREIRILKFRTMYSDAHTNPGKYFSPEQLETWNREQKVDNDPRITRVGGFLRKTSLDELPQFLNVLAGSMSVVGCRPVTYEETLNFEAQRNLALALKPGITGWWQVTERNDATWENGRRQEIELYYPHNASTRLDLSIVGRTVVAMLMKTGK